MADSVLRLACIIGVAVLVNLSSVANASPFTFQGQNSALFPGSNPYGLSSMMNSVTKPEVTSSLSSINPARLIQQSIISQISSKIYNDMFKGSATSGSYDLGGGNAISYLRSDGYITITITSPDNGTTTLTVLDQ